MNLAGSGGSANPKVGGKVSQDSYEKERGECSSRNAGKCKRISGVVVEKEELWKLKRHLGERDMRGDESKIERSLFSTINLDVGITDMSQKNREGISRNNNTDSWQKETSKEVGSERGQLVEEDSLAPQKITNRANIDPTHLQNQEEANREFGPESPQIHDAQFVMDPYNRDSWLNEGVILTLFLGKLLDEQESLASIWEDRSTIDLVDSSSWEDLVTSTTNPPTSSVGCWNHSQVRLLSPILD
ncbi:hypothetical protein V6N12_059983 [Hibiscus sabdariffa]|uniref:Uncharacterized protein n=1 Tax=Hibiscus sabdariffa TaxID=183260 RepID=A0ABR2D343_9ROSI